MPTPRPDVSVVIPVLNRRDRLIRAVRSCMNPERTVEVVVVDDGSTEPIRSILDTHFPDPMRAGRIRVFQQAHQGACIARNKGMAEAAGDFIKFLDSDDELIPGALAKEVAAARDTGCDALITGWHERTFDADGTEIEDMRRTRPAARLDRGIDDMLDGKGAITAAVLYRTAFIRPLRWDPEWTKAQDWGWLLTVCLAGARFASLDIPSCLYIHHPGMRITTAGDLQIRSTRARQQLLRMVERELRRQEALTESRKKQLAQYLYRDSQVLARHDPEEWTRVWSRCKALVPGFRPRDPNRILRLLTRGLGVHAGVKAYVALKAALLPRRGR